MNIEKRRLICRLYKQSHKEQIKEYNKKYRMDHREQIKEKEREYKLRNREKINANARLWIMNNPQKRLEYNAKTREWAKNNKEKKALMDKLYREKYKEELNAKKKLYYQNKKREIIEQHKIYNKNRGLIDPTFKIKARLRRRVKGALDSYSINGKIKKSDEYGIQYNKIIEKLKPIPENKEIYHIDHIIPLCKFDLNKSEEIKKAFAPENHQWLLARENMLKGGRL